MKLEFYKTNGVRGNSYVKLPIRSNAFLYIQISDTFFFTWSTLVRLYSSDHDSQRFTKYTKHFNKLDLAGFEIIYGMHIFVIPRCERLNRNRLSMNVFELQKQQRRKKRPLLNYIFISKYNPDANIIDLLLYKNHRVSTKNYVF